MVSVTEPVFPALSVQEPVTAAAAPSGPPYVPDVHDATPDAPSSPEKLNGTGLVSQPFASGPRAAEAVTLGGDESFRIVMLCPYVLPVAG
jgi:hypothetical protein